MASGNANIEKGRQPPVVTILSVTFIFTLYKLKCTVMFFCVLPIRIYH